MNGKPCELFHPGDKVTCLTIQIIGLHKSNTLGAVLAVMADPVRFRKFDDWDLGEGLIPVSFHSIIQLRAVSQRWRNTRSRRRRV